MKKIAALALAALALVPAAPAVDLPLRLGDMAAIVVDGADDEWPAVLPFELGSACQFVSGPPAPGGGRLTPSATVRALVDGRNLCLYAEFRDATPMRNAMRGNELYKGDCLEVFLRAGGDAVGGRSFGAADAQFGIAIAEGARSWIWGAHSGELSGHRAVVRATPSGAVLEARVPLSNFFPSYSPEAGDRLRVDFAFDESAAGDEREARMVWHGGEAAWRDPSSWGECILTEGDAPFLADAVLVPTGIAPGPERCFAYSGGRPWTGLIRVDGEELSCDADGMFIAEYKGSPFSVDFLGEGPATVYGFADGASPAMGPPPAAARDEPTGGPRSIDSPSTTRFRALLDGCLSAKAPDAASLALLFALAEIEGAKLDAALGGESFLEKLEPEIRDLLARELPAGAERAIIADRGYSAVLAGALALGAKIYAGRDESLSATLKVAALQLAEGVAATAGAGGDAAAAELLFCYAEIALLTGDEAWMILAKRAGYAVASCAPLVAGDISALAAYAVASDSLFPGYVRKRFLLQLRNYTEASAARESEIAGAPRATTLALAAKWFARDGALAAVRTVLEGIGVAAADKSSFAGAELAFLAGWLAAEAGN